jgi:hypothetical protein
MIQLEQLMSQLRVRLSRLMAMRRNERMADLPWRMCPVLAAQCP